MDRQQQILGGAVIWHAGKILLQLNFLCLPVASDFVIKLSAEHQAERWIEEEEVESVERM